ncbi:MAG: response regulator transcription factor [Syntrophobacteraceae bacterium]|nr:response regulator transcription factor [Syntrophobacteraceae bacterium]
MSSDVRRPRVVVADDESHCRVLIKAVLTSMNCEVVGEARTGDEAIELYRKHKPNLMLLDVNMPFKNGDEVLEELFSSFPDAFVIVLTSVTDMESIERCLSLGAANYIRKDTPISELKVIIKETWKSFQDKPRRAAVH